MLSYLKSPQVFVRLAAFAGGHPPASEALGQALDGGDQDRAEYNAHEAYRRKDKYAVILGPHRRAAPDGAPSAGFVYSNIWRSPIDLPKAAFGLALKVVVQRQLGLLGHTNMRRPGFSHNQHVTLIQTRLYMGTCRVRSPGPFVARCAVNTVWQPERGPVGRRDWKE